MSKDIKYKRKLMKATKHKMSRFKSDPFFGWNYRGYCVTEKCKGNAGLRWEMCDNIGEPTWFFRTLAEFRENVDRWERRRTKGKNF